MLTSRVFPHHSRIPGGLFLQTYTHLSLGAAMGATGFAHEPWSQAACVAGAVAPDLCLAFQYGLDLLRHRPPLVDQPRWLIVFKEVAHSLPLWAVALLFCLNYGGIFQAFCVGMVSHVLIDGFTHAGAGGMVFADD